MIDGGFTYRVGVEVGLTDSELDLLCRCAESHYDGTVKAAVAHGGFIYGWRNQRAAHLHAEPDAKLEEVPLEASAQQLGLVSKALESLPLLFGRDETQEFQAGVVLKLAVDRLLSRVGTEQLRCNEAGMHDGFECPRCGQAAVEMVIVNGPALVGGFQARCFCPGRHRWLTRGIVATD